MPLTALIIVFSPPFCVFMWTETFFKAGALLLLFYLKNSHAYGALDPTGLKRSLSCSLFLPHVQKNQKQNVASEAYCTWSPISTSFSKHSGLTLFLVWGGSHFTIRLPLVNDAEMLGGERCSVTHTHTSTWSVRYLTTTQPKPNVKLQLTMCSKKNFTFWFV